MCNVQGNWRIWGGYSIYTEVCGHPFKFMDLAISNQILFVECAEYKGCRPYSEMLIYKPLTKDAV